ncbi:hypothetical protein [Nocardioides sp.]|uniref:hypothetical protein n=1 Tax=Nocardioides sp. TaxID=35761 RepID=UPI0039E4EBA2
MARWPAALVIALAATLVAVGAGVVLRDPETPPPEPLATPLSSVDTTVVTVPRAPFCELVPAAEVAAAVGAGVTATSWDNGDPLPDSGDIAHEYGCSWAGESDTAQAWVFAPPVTTDRAGNLVASATAADGCAPVAGAAPFGSPTVALQCGDTLSYRGLFGDAWLVCTLTTTDPDLAGRWCVGVLAAASTVAPSAE